MNDISEDQRGSSLIDVDWEASVQLIVDELVTEDLWRMAEVVRCRYVEEVRLPRREGKRRGSAWRTCGCTIKMITMTLSSKVLEEEGTGDYHSLTLAKTTQVGQGSDGCTLAHHEPSAACPCRRRWCARLLWWRALERKSRCHFVKKEGDTEWKDMKTDSKVHQVQQKQQ